MTVAKTRRGTFPAAMLITWALISAGLPAHTFAQDQKTPGYSRADAGTIRQITEEILQDKNYAPHKPLWQWILENLSGWVPRLGNHTGFGRFLAVFLVTWCVLTLLAILIHLVWTLIIYFGGGSAGSPRAGQPAHLTRNAITVERLQEQMQELVGLGQWREAVGIMLVVLIRWLHSVQVVQFHPSKTNGDYLCEYRSAGSRESFQRFIRGFDGLVYGGRSCGHNEYQNMRQHYEAIIAHVRREKS
jgi:hypothetical protein